MALEMDRDSSRPAKQHLLRERRLLHLYARIGRVIFRLKPAQNVSVTTFLAVPIASIRADSGEGTAASKRQPSGDR